MVLNINICDFFWTEIEVRHTHRQINAKVKPLKMIRRKTKLHAIHAAHDVKFELKGLK